MDERVANRGIWRPGLSCPVVMVLLLAASARAQSLGPTGYWQYNGTGTVTDASLTSSGTNATSGVMTIGGTAAPAYTTAGMVGNGIEFTYSTLPTGSNAVKFLNANVSFGTNSAPSGGYRLGETFSLSTWYFVSNISTGTRTFLYEGETVNDISAGNGSSGSTTLTTYNTTVQLQSFSNALSTGTWRNIVQTFSAASGTTTMLTYIDGVISGTLNAVSSAMGDSGINFAGARFGTIRPLYGTLDETAVWAGQALTASQALDVYNRGLAGVYLTNTNAVRGYLTGTSDNAWLTGANWGGTAPGVTANAASTNGDVAIVGNYAFSNGLGIDMGSASGNLAAGAISFNSLQGTGGNLSIGNSSATSGTLTLNGAQIDGSSNVILNNEGLSNLTITNVQGTDSGQRMTLQVGGTASSIRAAAGRTLTVATDLAERTAGSSLSIDGAGLVVLSGSSSRTGATTVASGTLAGAAAGALGFGTTSVSSGATLRLDDTGALRNSTLAWTASSGSVAFNVAGTNTYTLGNLSGTGSLNAGANTLAVGASGGTAAFAGTVTAAMLDKVGSGVLSLTGSGAQSATRVSAGTIVVNNNAAFGSGTVTLAGGRLQLSTATSLANDISLDAAAAANTIGGVTNVEYLVVAGGGGGGGDNAGGGGGGGVLSGGTSVNLTSYLVTVGTGGAGGSGSLRGSNGGNSTIFGLTALGGGGGASGNTAASAAAASGGSGGGGEGESSGRQTGAAGTAGQGFAGGNGGGAGDFAGGGGGGAGGVGGNATGTTGTNGGLGGIGLQSFISGSGVYYGGGGGGGSSNANTFVASGGLGGGGAGKTNTADSGTNGLGGGGGGATFSSSATGGAGGSGVVIVRYLGGQSATGGTISSGAGSATGYTIHTFSGTGSSTLAFTAMDATLSGRISGTGGFTWNSAGRLTLSGSNSFSGGLVVASGTVQAADPNALGTGVVTIGNGGALAGTGTFSAGGLIFGTASGNTSTIAMTVTDGLPATGFAVNGDIVTNGGTNTVTFAFGSALTTIATGTYTLASYTGSLSGTSAFTYSGTKGGRQGISFADAGSALNMVVTNVYPIWTGSNGDGWSTTDNWKLNDDNAPTSFQANDTVLFTDGADTGTVSLLAAVAPLTTTVNADVLDYTFVDAGGRITAGSLAKSGSAALTITGSNSFGGGTTLSAGTLRIGNNSALGTGTLAISGGRLANDGVAARTIPNALSLTADVPLGSAVDTANLTIAGGVNLGGGSRTLTVDSPVAFSGTVSNGNLVKAGSGTLILSGNGNTFGTTTISSGTLQIGSGGTAGSFGTGAVVNDSALAFARSNSGTFANAISGAGTIRAISGTTALTGTSTFTGPVTIDAGARFGTESAGLLGGGSYAGAVATEGTLAIGSSLNQTLSGTISGGGSVVKSGAGTLTLSAANTFSGGVSLAGGAVSIADAAALGSGALAPTLAASSTLAFTSASAGSIPNSTALGNPGATARTFAIVKTASSSSTGTDLALSGAITGGGTAATVFLDTSATGDNTTTFTLSGSNTFRATINLNRGALVVQASENLGDPANRVRLDSNVNGSLGNLRFTAPMTVANPIEIASQAYPINPNEHDVVLAGPVSGASGLVKLGTGKLTLAGSNTYTTTTVSAGTLEVGSGGTTGSLGSGAVTNNATLAFNRSDAYGGVVANAIGGSGAVTVAGGTLTLTGANTYAGTTTIAAGAKVQVGNAGTTGSLGSGALTNDGTLAFARTNSITVSNTIGGAGALQVTSGTVVLAANNTYAGETTITGGVLRVGNGGAAGSLGSGGSVVNGGTVVFNRSDDYGGGFGKTISGAGAVAVSSGSLTLAAANTYAGNTTVASGATLALGDVSALQNSTLVTSATGGGVAFAVPGSTAYVIGAIAGSGAVDAGGNTLAVGSNGGSTTFSGNLVAAELVKEGLGTLTLTGSNSIGATTISEGAIFAGSNNALGNGVVTLAGGLLQVGKGVTLANEIVLSGPANAVTFAGGVKLDYLLVGGGGGGAARDSGGGGGGGGVEIGTTSVVTGGTYAVTVGAGGAGATYGSGDGGTSVGGSGGSSSFGDLTVLGGGGGGGYSVNGGNGASGGGGGRAFSGGLGTPGEGFNGGNGSGGTSSTVDAGGGGGGAGGVGGNAIASTSGGSGGIGLATDITGASTYYGGGGGGTPHRNASFASGTGGLGGGGNGAPALGIPGAGVDGLGGGGGAARSATSSVTSSTAGANGGSGVVIVRYLGSQAAAGGTVSSGSGSAAGYTLHTFLGAGSSSFVVDPVNVAISGAVTGAGGFTWDSPNAVLSLTGNNSYSGDTVVSAGKLVVNGDQGSASGLVTIGALAALGGSGTIGGATVIDGLHTPGNSPGLQTFTNGLQYGSTATLVWELYANTVLGRGTNYDAVDVTGGSLLIDLAATLQLDFGTTALGSTVDWDNAFWDTSHEWTVIATSGSATWNGSPFGTLIVGNDTLGRSLTSVRSDSTFSLTESDGNLVLVYAAVPEPGTIVLAGCGLACAAGWVVRRRRRKRDSAA